MFMRIPRNNKLFLIFFSLWKPRHSSENENNWKKICNVVLPLCGAGFKKATSWTPWFYYMFRASFIFALILSFIHIFAPFNGTMECSSHPQVCPMGYRSELKDSNRFWFPFLIRKKGEREGNDATGVSPQIADNIRQPVSNEFRSYRQNLPEPCK